MQVRRLMGNDDTYLNFMRCLALYNKDVVTGSELIEILQPFTLLVICHLLCFMYVIGYEL